MSTTVGGLGAKVIRIVSPPRVLMSSWWTMSMTCWAGFSAWCSSMPMHALADAGHEVADDLEVDVGLEQGEADLPQDLVDLGLAEPAPAPEAGEDALEPVGERVEHGSAILPVTRPQR